MRSLYIAILMVISPLAAMGHIVVGPISNPANGNDYYILEPNSWVDSQAAAVELGGNLVTINDPSEQAWLIDQFGPIDSDNSHESFWIGLNDVNTEGQFEWVSGEPVVYQNWFTNEPNGGLLGLEGDYVYIGRFANGQWNDDTNNVSGNPMPHGVVEVVNSPEPASLVLFTMAGFMIMGCRKIHS